MTEESIFPEDAWAHRDLWVVARGGRQYLIANDQLAYFVVDFQCTGRKLAALGPMRRPRSLPLGWIEFDKPLPYRGPLLPVSSEEIQAMRGAL